MKLNFFRENSKRICISPIRERCRDVSCLFIFARDTKAYPKGASLLLQSQQSIHKYHNILLAVFLIGVIAISGCSREINTTGQPSQSSSSVLSEVCSAGAGNVTEYSFDVGGDGFERVDAATTLTAKCNVFSKCALSNEKNIFNLYAKKQDSEKNFFDRVNFTASVALIAETDEQNKTMLIVGNKTYSVKRNDSEMAVEIEGKTIRLGIETVLNGVNLKLYQYRDGVPLFLTPVIEENDIVNVDLASENTQVFKMPPSFGRFSIAVQISNSSAKKISNLVNSLQTVIDFNSNEANLNAKIYYFVDKALLSIVQLPAKIKEIDKYPHIIIQGVEDTYLNAVKNFNWIKTGLKLQTYPEIKILKTKTIDCRDI